MILTNPKIINSNLQLLLLLQLLKK